MIDSNRLSAKERKKIFAHNLDSLLKVTGMRRKCGAVQIGVSYVLIRRLASAGVSRIVARNVESIHKIADFFKLEKAEDLWEQGLMSFLLKPGTKFVEAFRESITRTYSKNRRRHSDIKWLNMLSVALGLDEFHEQNEQREKVNKILDSPKGGVFKKLIDDYYLMSQRRHKWLSFTIPLFAPWMRLFATSEVRSRPPQIDTLKREAMQRPLLKTSPMQPR